MMKSLLLVASFLGFALQSAQAQDPATGWMAYAVGTLPSGVDRITTFEAEWKVGADPKRSSAFFSPWFGMDPSDNLNLVQPVNPWSGSSWSMYTEYYQWSPTHNSNSRQYSVEAGQTLQGGIYYEESTDSYNLTQYVVETGDYSHQIVKCQNGKKFTIPYFVYEKTFPCSTYPPDEIVAFYNIYIECDGKDCTNDIQWSAEVKDANCNMQANILSPTNITITWSTSGESKYDDLTDKELFDLNYHGWAKNVDNIKTFF